jgi:hypothetical protein
MNMISKDIFMRLMEVNKINSLKQLSNEYGFTDNWATTTRKREGIPFEICAKTAIKYNVSMDYLIFGIENSNKVDINELKLSVTEGVFAAIQADMIVLNKDVKISHVTETITSEIKEACNINDENQKLNKAQ